MERGRGDAGSIELAYERAAAISLFLLFGLLAWRNVTDLDVGIHLAAGRWIVENHRVPGLDPFTWTVFDRPYVAYHWLFQLGLYTADQLGGPTGMAALRWLLLAGTFALLADILRLRQVRMSIAAPLGLLAIAAAEWRFAERPELCSFFLLAATLWVLERRRAQGPGPLWVLPLIQIVWVNTHVFVLGWLAIVPYVVDELVKERRLDRRLGLWLAAAAAADFVNPYGVTGVLYPLVLATRLRESNLFAREIAELASPFALRESAQFPFSIDLQLGAFHVLLAAGVPVLVYAVRQKRISDCLLLVLFGGLAALAVRNIPLFLIAGLAPLAWAVDRLLPRRSNRLSFTRGIGSGVLIATSLLALLQAFRVITGTFYAEQRRPVCMEAGIARTELAVDAADWLVAHDLKGPGFNNLNVGGSLLWRAPERKVFIDGRNEVTGEQFFSRYLHASNPAGWDAAAAWFGFEYAVIGHRTAMSLVRHIAASTVWRMVYADPVAVIFVRSNGLNNALPAMNLPEPVTVEERVLLFNRIAVEGSWWQRFGNRLWLREPTPGPDFQLGTFFLLLGKPLEAERFLLAAAGTSPHFYETHMNLGAVYTRLQLPGVAARCYRNVLALEPGQELALRRLPGYQRR